MKEQDIFAPFTIHEAILTASMQEFETATLHEMMALLDAESRYTLAA
jgi:hypothetical protein